MFSRRRLKKPRRPSSRSGSGCAAAGASWSRTKRSCQSRAMRSGRIEARSPGTEIALSWGLMSALPEARESLTYWESRLERLPRRAVRKRREAREMAARWRTRVQEAERARYGAGILGALFMLYVERRLPASTRHTSRQVVRV